MSDSRSKSFDRWRTSGHANAWSLLLQAQHKPLEVSNHSSDIQKSNTTLRCMKCTLGIICWLHPKTHAVQAFLHSNAKADSSSGSFPNHNRTLIDGESDGSRGMDIDHSKELSASRLVALWTVHRRRLFLCIVVGWKNVM